MKNWGLIMAFLLLLILVLSPPALAVETVAEINELNLISSFDALISQINTSVAVLSIVIGLLGAMIAVAVPLSTSTIEKRVSKLQKDIDDYSKKFEDYSNMVEAIRNKNSELNSTYDKLRAEGKYMTAWLSSFGDKNFEFEQKISLYTEAIEINKNFEKAYNNRGHVYYLHDRYHEAVKDFTEAIKLNDTYYNAYNNLIASLVMLKDYRQAQKYIFEAIKKGGEKTNHQIYLYFAMVCIFYHANNATKKYDEFLREYGIASDDPFVLASKAIMSYWSGEKHDCYNLLLQAKDSGFNIYKHKREPVFEEIFKDEMFGALIELFKEEFTEKLLQ